MNLHQKKFFLLSLILVVTFGLFIGHVLAAQQIPADCLKATGGEAHECANDLIPKVKGFSDFFTFSSISQNNRVTALIGSLINFALAFLGVIFLILTIISGFQWLTAGSSSENIKKANDRLKNSVIGLIITLSAFGISYFVLNKIESLTKPDTIKSCLDFKTATDCQYNSYCVWKDNQCLYVSDQ